jgi:DNA mismatch endonuclease (patch repair protein)
MSAQRTIDTAPEVALRSELHSRGLRFRVGRRPVPGLRRTADIVFGPTKVAVLVDGCFWHGCPIHGTSPQANGEWWARKLARNRERDAETTAAWSEAGWTVVRVWEHEHVGDAADRVEASVAARRLQTSSG